MKKIDCAHESAIIRAARAGHWKASDLSIKAHAAECAGCHEILQTARWMQSLATRPANEAALPEPGMVWWKFQLAERQAGKERARKIGEWSEACIALTLAVGLAGAFAWVWPRLQGPLADAMTGSRPQWWTATWSAVSALSGADSQILLWVLLGAVGLSLFYPLLMEEE